MQLEKMLEIRGAPFVTTKMWAAILCEKSSRASMFKE